MHFPRRRVRCCVFPGCDRDLLRDRQPPSFNPNFAFQTRSIGLPYGDGERIRQWWRDRIRLVKLRNDLHTCDLRATDVGTTDCQLYRASKASGFNSIELVATISSNIAIQDNPKGVGWSDACRSRDTVDSDSISVIISACNPRARGQSDLCPEQGCDRRNGASFERCRGRSRLGSCTARRWPNVIHEARVRTLVQGSECAIEHETKLILSRGQLAPWAPRDPMSGRRSAVSVTVTTWHPASSFRTRMPLIDQGR